MSFLLIVTLFLNILFCIPSLASMTKFDQWWIRGFDFPRIQISVIIFINILMGLFVYPLDSSWQYVILVALLFSLCYQYYLIHPYTVFATKQVLKYTGHENEDTISILVSNVLTENRDFEKLISLVNFRKPDVLLTLETDKRWEDAMKVLENDFQHTVKVPLDNLYGMHLYSKLPLENMEVKYLVKEGIPSIHGNLILPNGKVVKIHCLHPKPPSPSEDKTSTNRDAELLLVGKEINKEAVLTLVFGDFNDVAWSRTTKIFQKMSGLLDPRRGRGFFNTFNANYKLLRWPLDHVFHTKDFSLIEIAREPHIGSDHFPMYIKLNYTPKAKWEQKQLDITQDEQKWAEGKIKKGNPKEKSL